MRSRTCFFVILIFVSSVVLAQDKLYKKDGSIIEVIIKTVGSNTVNYKRFDNQDGPEYTILKKEVNKIVYQNGTTDNFEGRSGRPSGKEKGSAANKNGKFTKKYGDHIISIIPGAYTASMDGTINDVGIGISYERLLDPRGHISLNIPILINFSSNRDFNNSSIYYNGTYIPTSNGSYTSLYFMPGVQFYPASSKEKVRYSIGVSFFTIFGSEPYGVYDNTGNNTTIDPNSSWNYTVYGFMFSNSVHISATKHFIMSIDLGTGFPVSDNRHADNNGGLDNLIGPWIQFGFKAGYRF